MSSTTPITPIDDDTTGHGSGSGSSGGSSGGSGGGTLAPSPYDGAAFGLDEVEVRFCDRKTGLRLFFNPAWVTHVSVDLTEAGGVDTIKVSVAAAFDAAFAPTEGCLVEVVVLTDPAPTGRPEPWPRYRGILSAPDATLSEAETRSLLAYGFMEDMTHVPLSGSLIAPGGGDVSQLAAQVLHAYVAERPWLNYSSSIEPTGVSRNGVELSDADCRKAMDVLAAQSPGLAVWGWRVSQVTGRNEFVSRPRAATVGNQFSVGANVLAYALPKELSKVFNAMRLTGATSLFPNLLASATSDNTSFEKAEIASASTPGSNLVQSFGFEVDSPWTFGGGATSQNADYEGPAFEGSHVAEFDNAGEYVQQSVGNSTSIKPGHTYILSFQNRKYGDLDSRGGTWSIQWKNAGGTNVGAAVSATFAPRSLVWEEVRGAALSPAGATQAVVKIQAGTGGGRILLDGVAFFDQGDVQPVGWETLPFGTAGFEIVDPLFTADHWSGDGFGRSCIRIRGHFSDINGNDGHLRPRNNAFVKVSREQVVRYLIRAKRTPGTDRTVSGKMFLEVDSRKTDYSPTGTTSQTVVAAGSLTDAWQTFILSHLVPSDAAYVQLRTTFRGDCDCLIDAQQLRDEAAGDDYIQGEKWQRYVQADDVCDVGTPARASFDTYDRRTAYVTNESLTEWNDAAQAWVKAYLTQMALPPVRAKLSLSHEAIQQVDPLNGTLVRVAGLAIALPDAYPARVSLDFSSMARSASIELGGEQPTLARLIAGGKDKKSVSVGGGGASVSTSALTSLAVSGAIAATLPAVQAGSDAAAEVIAARTRAAGSGWATFTWANLKAHLGALWVMLGKRTADPSSEAAGRVLMADGTGGVVFGPVSGTAAGVSTVNGRDGDITFSAGTGITVAETPVGTFTVSATGGGGSGSTTVDGHCDVEIVSDSDDLTAVSTFAKTIVYRKTATTAVVYFLRGTVGTTTYFGSITFLNATSHGVSISLADGHWGGSAAPTIAAGGAVLLVRTIASSDDGAVWFKVL